MENIPTYTLKSGIKIPKIGFGTWQLKGEEAIRAVTAALQVGYRHIDTADVYDNHSEVKQSIENSELQREDLFLTTKVWRDDLAKQDTIDAVNRFLEELDTDYIDLLLIHWPNKDIPISETLQTFNELKNEGKIKAIGVSNFTMHHLQDALKSNVVIDINQIEVHPLLNQSELKKFCDDNNIITTAYSPLAQGEALIKPLIIELADKYNVSSAQVVLNWLLSRGMVVIPKSNNKEHIKDNLNAANWQMEEADIEKINSMANESYRVVNPPFNEFDY
ncbi:oxidoreductase [candidate division WWE3 bacterium CG10_big_fil_rev_8_21_14_0_10_32_10]|uniref:Oxidoreductase n=1 Tax=candidate division WWE3 bacterium CG10_big_fil_rev_8_21_14_0_10_32_10 TaxID=1975090 RepID=A0A2H0R963_UNCKA|nr:MAG: oxidoreductase [candidate division WWE3 bacterium CG10_big_fil_rev_8_21_14_0_10_32_10]